MGVGAELTYNSNVTALQMANTIFGDGVSVLSASYSGPSYSAAIYSDGQLSPGVVPSNRGVILSTGRADSFTQHNGNPNRSTGTSTDTTGTNNNAQFNAVAGAPTYDAVWLDATFVPTGNTMTIKFVFASEEYPEYINSQFNDVVGVWVNGSAVPISVGTGRTSVNNINTNTQPNLTVSNVNDTYNTEMDGFTVTLSLDMQVTPGVANTIRIGIADVSDAQYDSNLLIAADSVQTAVVARDDSVTMFATGTQTINVLGNDQSASGNALVITQINGVPVVAGQTVVLPSGQQIRLNADGTFTITGDGQTENTSFTYTVSNAHGNGNGVTDTAIVNLTQIPCFVAGTLIGTPGGPRRVEGLTPGDLVLTVDDGAQPLRWIGRRTVPATGNFAPIRIAAGAFGDHGTLLVSPQHRVLLRDAMAELLFGEDEVLVAAKDLLNHDGVCRVEGGQVEYVHLLFDRHQVIWAEGLPTESFLPGPQMSHSFDGAVLQELVTLFPELDPMTGHGYGPAARRMLRGYEAQLLLTGAA